MELWNNNNHLMIDLETLGTDPYSLILSISAVIFNPFTGEDGKRFELFIDPQDGLNEGFKVTGDTILWWLGQEDGPRMEIVEKCVNGYTVSGALLQFSRFIEDNNVTYLWGKGPSFDLSRLTESYDKLNMTRPWKYWNERCVRTMIDLVPQTRDIPFVGDKHNGIDDSLHQIKQVHESLKELLKSKEI